MRNLNRFVSSSLLTTTAIVGLPYFFTQVAFSQTLPQQKLSKWEISQNKEPLDQRQGGPRADNPPVEQKPGGVRGENNNENTPPTEEKPGGPRPITTCSIAPQSTNTDKAEVWSDRPLFVWRGPVGKIEVRKFGSQDALWSKTITGQNRYVMYEGNALQPGQTYSLVIFDLSNKPIAENTFQVMETEKRAQLEKQLQILETELKAKGASPEEIALSRADLFAKRQLWSDVWREIALLQNPSATVATYVRNIPIPACSSAAALNSSPAP